MPISAPPGCRGYSAGKHETQPCLLGSGPGTADADFGKCVLCRGPADHSGSPRENSPGCATPSGPAGWQEGHGVLFGLRVRDTHPDSCTQPAPRPMQPALVFHVSAVPTTCHPLTRPHRCTPTQLHTHHLTHSRMLSPGRGRPPPTAAPPPRLPRGHGGWPWLVFG